MGFLHSRNVSQFEVDYLQQTLGRVTQQEARLRIREENMGATEDQALTIQIRSLK